MKLLVVLCIVAAAIAEECSEEELKLWKSFKVEHGKMFMSKNKEAARMKTFLKNHAKVQAINADFSEGKETYTAKIYPHHDLSRDEFKARFCGAKKNNNTDVRMAPMMRQTPLATLDLSLTPEVGAVKNQGQCGSCWTFSSTAATESRFYRNSNKKSTIILSEQELVNCVLGTDGCEGGWMPEAFAWIQKNGQTTSARVPYTGVYGKCTTPSKDFVAKGQAQIPNNVNAIKNALNTNGVLAIAVDATYWSDYSKGIFSVPSAKNGEINHAVALVGYGTDNGIDFWKIRNSWGSGWGEKGYIRVPIKPLPGKASTYETEDTFTVL